MQKFSILLSFLFLCQVLSAQIGVTVSYKQMTANNWQEVIVSQNQSLNLDRESYRNGLNFGIDYWIKPLKNYRIELMPEVSYSRFSSAWKDSNFSISEEIVANNINFKLNTNFYLLNMEGDCDCPTFSKDGDIINKGFFIQLSPGISYLQNAYTNEPLSDTKTDFKATDLSFNIGLGAGLDIGLSDLLTVTPFVKYTRHFDAFWENLDSSILGEVYNDGELNTSNLSVLEAGLRIGLRFDQ